LKETLIELPHNLWSPLPRTTARAKLGTREDDEDRAWARALATFAFSSNLLLRLFLSVVADLHHS
jgi:hypothetical protein